MKEINLSIENEILNNGVIDDLSDEQKCILSSFDEIFQNLEIKTFGNINIVLNFKVNDDEFDWVSIFSDLDKKTYYILFLEVKDFSSLEGFESEINDKRKKGFQKFASKLTNFQKMFLNRYGSIVDNWNIKIFGMFYAINSEKPFSFFEIYNGQQINYSRTKFRELMNYFFKFKKTQNLNVIKALNDILSKPNDVSKFCNYIVNGPERINLKDKDKVIWKINESSARIVIFDGVEGSGKTTLAFNIYASKLKNQENAILWFISPSFCKEINRFLKTNYENFIHRKPLFHFDDVKNRMYQFSEKEKTIIIDDAQRLTEEQVNFLNEWLKNQVVSKLILFYDQNQRIAKTDVGSIKKIEDLFKENGQNIDFVRLETNHRISNLDEIKYYLYLKSNAIKNKQTSNKWPKCSFKLCSSFDEFLTLFKSDEPKTKIMAALQYSDNYNIDKLLTDAEIMPSINLKNNRDWFFINKEKKNCYFSPYELSSREINECFLFLGENIKFDKGKITSTTKELNQMLSSQLNTLISRATQRLVVFAVDVNLRAAIASRSEKK